MRKQMTKGMRCGYQCAWKAAEYKILSGVFTLIQRSTEAFSDPRSGRCAKTAPGAGPFPDSRAAEARRRGCHCRRCDGRVPAADGHRAYSAYDSADTDMPFCPSGRYTDRQPPASSRCDSHAGSWPAPALSLIHI